MPPLDPDDIQRFANCWNEGRFFDAHETLEPRWIATRDRGLRGLIQLAAALLHLSRGNIKGARTTLERAIVRLRDPQNAACPIDQTALAAFGTHVLERLETTPPDSLVKSRPRLEVGPPRAP
ncbi:MAG TPA: DUF309 domain-containing protein [Candidatus Acidoferrales bacterium]|nr:DUF309 domain-containing protein [Candidatus Acidoferrales bacterium]